MASNVPNWHEIRADFTGSNQLMKAAGDMWSQAGTVFGQMRKEILDQEQREIENAFRQQEMDEKARQFGITSAETSRHNQAVEKHQADQLKATTDYHTAMSQLARDQFEYTRQKDAEQKARDEAVVQRLLEMNGANDAKNLELHRQQVLQAQTEAGATDEQLGMRQAALQDMDKKIANSEAYMRDRYQPIVSNGIKYDYDPDLTDERNAAIARHDTLVTERDALRNEVDRMKIARREIEKQYPAPVSTAKLDNMSRALGIAAVNPNSPLIGTFATLAGQAATANAQAEQKALDRQSREKVAYVNAGARANKNLKVNSGKYFKSQGVRDGEWQPLGDAADTLIALASANNKKVPPSLIQGWVADELNLKPSKNPFTDDMYNVDVTTTKGDLLEVVKALRDPNAKVSSFARQKANALLRRLKNFDDSNVSALDIVFDPANTMSEEDEDDNKKED